MSLEVLTTPIADILDLSEIKEQLRVTTTSEDELIKTLLKVAQDKAQTFTHQGLLLTQYKMRLDNFKKIIYLPASPVVKVNSIQYIDTNGTTQTLDTSVYTVDRHQNPCQIFEAYNQDWPTVRDVANAVTITYQAGYIANCTVDHSTDLITVLDNPFINGDVVRLRVSGGNDKALPAGLDEFTDYYIVNVSGDDFQLSETSGGSPISLSNAGIGTFYIGYQVIPSPFILAIKLMITDWYYNRGNDDQVIPAASYHLLMPYKLDSF